MTNRPEVIERARGLVSQINLLAAQTEYGEPVPMATQERLDVLLQLFISLDVSYHTGRNGHITILED